MALCQKFGRLLIGAEARFFARTDVTNFSTSLNQSPASKQIPARLPSGYNAPTPFALFIKDQLTGQSGDPKLLKIVSTNWKILSEDEKQNYSERAKKIGAELRDNFEKLTNGQKKDLWDKHVEKKNKLQRLRMKKKLQKEVLISRRITQSPTPTQILARLPAGYNSPKPFALFVKDQLTGKSGDPKLLKIVSTNWKSLSEDKKQNYTERAKKIGDELRDNFEKLTNRQKKDLWDKHVEKKNKLQGYRMKKKLQKFHSETNRPKQPLPSYMLFMKERFVKHTEPVKTRDEGKKFVVETGKRWRQMTDAEKRAQRNIAKFCVEMAEWKRKYANEIRAWKETEAKAALKASDTQFIGALFELNIDDDKDLNEKQRIHQMLMDDSTHLVERREWSSDDDKDEEEEAIQRMFLAISTYLGRKEISQNQRIEY